MHIETPLICSDDFPPGAVPARGKLRTGYLQGYNDLVRSLGGNPCTFLERHDIDPSTFEDPDYDIACTAAANLLEYSSKCLREPLFGLRLAERQDPDAYGCMITLARAAPTVRQALSSLVDYVTVSASPEAEIKIVTAREITELRFSTTAGIDGSEQVYYQGLLLTMKTLQMLGREQFRPCYASVTFDIGRSAIQLLQDRLGCKVRTKAEANAVAFPVSFLDCPVPTANRLVFDVLGSYLAQLSAASRGGVVEQVRAYVRRALPTRRCSVKECAEQIGTAVRTLQKRLMRTGVKFSDIAQQERTGLAKHALLWQDSTLDEIAFQLGYAEQTSFGRAFKRATGTTPQAFRSRRGAPRRAREVGEERAGS